MTRRMTESLTVRKIVVVIVFDDREGALFGIADQSEMRRWPAGVNCIANILELLLQLGWLGLQSYNLSWRFCRGHLTTQFIRPL